MAKAGKNYQQQIIAAPTLVKEQPYRVLVETMNEGVATLAADGTVIYCNSRLAAMLRVPIEKLIGTQLETFVAPADRPLFLARLGKCREECDNDEIAMITGEGDPLPVLISCCSLDLSGSRNISMVVTDLSQQKRNDEILAAEKLASSIIEQAGEAIVVCDEEGNIIRASRSAHQLCGENPLLKPFNELFRLRIAETECLFSVETPLQGGSFESVEVEYLRSEDQIFNLILNATPLKNVQNMIIGCVLTLTDITERRQAEVALRQSELRLLAQNQELLRLWEKSQAAEEALKKLNEELEERVAERTKDLENSLRNLEVETSEHLLAMVALREKEQMLIQQSRQAAMGEMIGNIAHQWRQPLNTLGLYIQRLELYYDTGSFTKELLSTTTSESMRVINHMSLTIDDFRNFFQPNKEKFKFKVREALANTLSLMEGSLQTPKITIEVVEKGDPVIYGYQNEFAQVLLNILINAKDVLLERMIDNPRVTITLCCEDDCAVVTIADNAGGISEEIIGKIFDPYFTTKGPQHGTGVGLFMSKSIIEKNMSGKLEVTNIANGAEFRIEVCNDNDN